MFNKPVDHVIESDFGNITVPKLGYWKVKEAKFLSDISADQEKGGNNVDYMVRVILMFAESRGIEISDIEEAPFDLIEKVFNFFIYEENAKAQKKEDEGNADPKEQTGMKSGSGSSDTTQDASISAATNDSVNVVSLPSGKRSKSQNKNESENSNSVQDQLAI